MHTHTNREVVFYRCGKKKSENRTTVFFRHHHTHIKERESERNPNNEMIVPIWTVVSVGVLWWFGVIADIIYGVTCQSIEKPPDIMICTPSRGLMVMLHGHNGIPQAWNKYYNNFIAREVSVFIPHVKVPSDRDRVFGFIMEYRNEFPDNPIVIMSTSMGSILGADIHAALQKNGGRSHLISIAGVFHGTKVMDFASATGLTSLLSYNPVFVKDLSTHFGRERVERWHKEIPPSTVTCFYNSIDYKVIPSSSSILHPDCTSYDYRGTGHSAIVNAVYPKVMLLSFMMFHKYAQEEEKSE